MSRLVTLTSTAEDIGALPGAYAQLARVMNTPGASADIIAKVVRMDPGLTARLLRVVNSARYSPPQPVETVSYAATMIGTRELQQMALATSIIHMFRGLPEHLMNMQRFWTHSIAVGLCAERIGKRIRHPEKEHLFLAGLLHDIGELAICMSRPRDARIVFIEAENTGKVVHDLESEILGFHHGEVGAQLMRSWGLAEIYAEVAEHHHQPRTRVKYRHAVAAAVVHVADVCVAGLQIGCGGERSVPPFDPAAWELVGLRLSDLPDVLADVEDAVEDLIVGMM